MENIFYIIIAILSLCFLIFIHELGHYTAGRLLKFKILEFSVGFGPAFFKKEKKGILYSLRVLPLGGYCKFLGEDEDIKEEGAMNAMPAWKRVIVLAAGVTFNILFAILLAFSIFLFVGDDMPVIDSVNQGQPAYQIMQKGDVIIGVNNKMMVSYQELFDAIEDSEGKAINIEVLRNGEKKNLSVTPQSYTDEEGNTAPKIGIALSNESYHVNFNIFESFERAIRYCNMIVRTIFDFVGNIFTGGISANDVSGPITTIGIMSEYTMEYGIDVLLRMIVMISINLALFNILPIPSLDGARIVFVVLYAAVEKVRGKKVSHRAEGIIHAAGLVLLFAFVIFVELNHLLSK